MWLYFYTCVKSSPKRSRFSTSRGRQRYYGFKISNRKRNPPGTSTATLSERPAGSNGPRCLHASERENLRQLFSRGGGKEGTVRHYMSTLGAPFPRHWYAKP